MSGIALSHLRSLHLSFAERPDNLHRLKANVLAGIFFSLAPGKNRSAATNLPLAHVPMASLAADGTPGSVCEIWCADGALTYGQRDMLKFCHNDEILCGVIQLAEKDFDVSHSSDVGRTPLQKATAHAYQEIFKLSDALAFGNILRFWNYFADINGESHGTERYRQFNVGRQDGFLTRGRKITGSVPAACALGFAEGPLTVCFFAARGVTPLAIENPRQISAYQYPVDYGKCSPTFSRAVVAQIGGGNLLFLSGTASIVGHQTLHAGDVLAQTRETIINIEALVTEANRSVPSAGFNLADLCYKVYVRHAKDVIAIDRELRRSLGRSARLTYLNADICRDDLLIEIEATAGHPMEHLSA